MGNHQLPNRRIYLGNFTHLLAISTTMTRNTFDEIISILHFNDNKIIFPVKFPNSYKLHKIRPLSTISEVNSKKLMPETCQAINEMMVPFKDKHEVKMNMP